MCDGPGGMQGGLDGSYGMMAGGLQQCNRQLLWYSMCMAAGLCLPACQPVAVPAKQHLIIIDGSSTLFPLAEAFAEEFQQNGNAAVAVGSSSSSGGISRLCHAEIDIATASRPMTAQEIQLCRHTGVSYLELPLALDAIAIVVHPSNDWTSCLTVQQLRQLWQPQAQGQQSRWQQLDTRFPGQAVHLYGAGISSGTYDYFSTAIVGKRHASRGDYAASEDDNMTVRGVAGDRHALGFMGLSYYLENKNLLRAVAIRQPDGQCRLPDVRNTQTGEYRPLTRVLFMYVSKSALQQKPLLQQFIGYVLDSRHYSQLSSNVGFVPLTAPLLQQVQQKVRTLETGSAYAGGVAGNTGRNDKGLQDFFVPMSAPLGVPVAAPGVVASSAVPLDKAGQP